MGGSALLRPRARRASPPPSARAQSTARGARQSEGGGAAYTGGGGGGGGLNEEPKRRQQESVRGGQASKRGRGHPDPPPPRAKRARVMQQDAASMGAPGRRSHNPTPREVLTQARPLAVTPTGAGQDGAHTVRCTDFGGALGDNGGPWTHAGLPL